ncbi:MAG: hypothetical protein WCK03_03200 [Candidatus Taylorbacteria bacterium]
MLYVFHGSDINRSIEKAHKLIDSLLAKRPGASYVQINSDSWSIPLVESHLGGQGLFSNKYIVFLDRVSENVEAKEHMADLVSLMNESSNIFVSLEGLLNVEIKKIFDKGAEKVVVTELLIKKAANGNGEYNIFALSDALSSRNRAVSWTIYRQAVDRGMSSESILGTLFWKVKTMILASNEKGSGKYSKNELQSLLTKIIILYHDGHRGLVDMELGIEKLLLEL